MDVALNRSNSLVSPPPIERGIQSAPLHRMEANVPPREVIRCQGCQLVQFRTVSGRCRRCARPLLPRLVLVPRIASAEEPSQALGRRFPVRPPGPPRPFLLRDAHFEKPKIGAKLIRLRKERGLSQTELARLTGIPRSYVSRMENDHLTPGPRIVSRLAAAVGVPIVDLLSSERDSGSARFLSKDPTCARLLSEFPGLEPQEMAAVLAEVRQMVEGNAVTTARNESPRRSSSKTKAAVA